MVGPARRKLAGCDQQARQLFWRAFEFPGPERLLEQPQAHDVAQVPNPAVDATLVGEVRPPTLLGQDCMIELHSDQ